MNSIHVSIVAIPDAMFSTLSGIYDVLNAFSMLSTYDDAIPKTSPFQVEIVAPTQEAINTASGLPLNAQRAIADVNSTDIAIATSLSCQERLHRGTIWYSALLHDMLARQQHRPCLSSLPCNGTVMDRLPTWCLTCPLAMKMPSSETLKFGYPSIFQLQLRSRKW